MDDKEAFDVDMVVATTNTLPVAMPAELPEIKLFGRWNCDDVQVNDMSLQDYIAVKEKNAKYLPHSAGRYAAKRFRKAQCPIVERLTNSLMMHGRNNGKKLMAVRIVKHAFEIIHLLTGENPLQVNLMNLFVLAALELLWACSTQNNTEGINSPVLSHIEQIQSSSSAVKMNKPNISLNIFKYLFEI